MSTAFTQRHSGSSVRFPKPRAQAQSASNQFQASPPSGSSRIQTVYRESLSAHRGTCAASPFPQVPLPPMGLGFSQPAMPTSRQLSPIQDRPCRWTTTSPACAHGYPSWLPKAYTTQEARSASSRADVCLFPSWLISDQRTLASTSMGCQCTYMPPAPMRPPSPRRC